MNDLDKLGREIARRVRELRVGRHMTQAELAAHLHLSQNRLSEIERGRGSFTAEQLIVMLTLFNVTVSHFAPPPKENEKELSVQAHLQNALARLGATQLREMDGVLPTERVAELDDVIRETLFEGNPRQLTALAPVIVRNIKQISLRRSWLRLVPLDLQRRFGWVLENTLEAIRIEQSGSLRRAVALRYRRAATVLETFLSAPPAVLERERAAPPDLLDETARGKVTVDLLEATASAISHRWRILTDLQPQDFTEALRAARD
ncbi:MAG: helix-turn-helix transcriptional regulator [Polyangiaceae bacterium]